MLERLKDACCTDRLWDVADLMALWEDDERKRTRAAAMDRK